MGCGRDICKFHIGSGSREQLIGAYIQENRGEVGLFLILIHFYYCFKFFYKSLVVHVGNVVPLGINAAIDVLPNSDRCMIRLVRLQLCSSSCLLRTLV